MGKLLMSNLLNKFLVNLTQSKNCELLFCHWYTARKEVRYGLLFVEERSVGLWDCCFDRFYCPGDWWWAFSVRMDANKTGNGQWNSSRKCLKNPTVKPKQSQTDQITWLVSWICLILFCHCELNWFKSIEN